MVKDNKKVTSFYSIFRGSTRPTKSNTYTTRLDPTPHDRDSEDSFVITSPTLPEFSRTMHNRNVTMSSGPPSPNDQSPEKARSSKPIPLNLSSDDSTSPHQSASGVFWKSEFNLGSPMMKSKGRTPPWRKWTSDKSFGIKMALLGVGATLFLCSVLWLVLGKTSLGSELNSYWKTGTLISLFLLGKGRPTEPPSLR